MTQGARDAEPLDVPVGGDLGLDAHDGVPPEQLDRRRRTGEIGTGEEAGRQPGRIDLETHRQRRRRRHAGLNHLVQVQRVGPERLVAEGPVSKDVPALRGVVRQRTRDQISGGRGGRATSGRDDVGTFTAGEEKRHERDQTHTTS